MNYKQKYLKYKLKYLKLKKLSGGLSQEFFEEAAKTDADYEKREEINFQIKSIGDVIDNNSCKQDKIIDTESVNQIDLHLNNLSSLVQYMDCDLFEYLTETLSKMYNKEDVEAIIEEHFPETQHIPEQSPPHSNQVIPTPLTRRRSSTLDRMTFTVREPKENNSRCNNVCNIM